jgi:phosphoribosylformylglycinamidine cyclo-ligase
MTSKNSLTYKAAGVDIDAGAELVERIKGAVGNTLRPEVIGGLGGFGGLFRVPRGYTAPVLVAGTDGVGTKLALAVEHDAHDTIGTDLVAMCVNDIVVQGAEPLFFLDYYVTPRLDVDVAERVLRSIARACSSAGAALLGGETAEHPGLHAAGSYDLAGFCVGIVDEHKLIDGRDIVAGDVVIGLASSGAHSNGYSLIRRVLERDPAQLARRVGGHPLLELLLAPTRIYVPALLKLFDVARVKGLAHITGGGLVENIPRVLPPGLAARLDAAAWPRPAVFDWLEDQGVARAEQYRTFNCGVGMTIIAAPGAADSIIAHLAAAGETAWAIGEIVTSGERGVIIA